MKDLLKKKKEALGRAWEAYKEHRDSLGNDQSKWSTDDKEKFDRLDADVDRIENEIRALEKDIDREERMAEREGEPYRPGVNDNQPQQTDDEKRKLEVFDRYLRNGMSKLSVEERAMMAGDDVSGGYLVAPQQMVDGILKNVDDAVVIRQLATVQKLRKAASLGVVKLDDDIDDWTWTSELLTGSEDTGLGFGKREMRPYPIAKRLKISETLIRLSNTSVTALVEQRMAYKMGGTMESAYMTGTGNRQPLGLFTASDDGIPTSRDVSTDNTTTALTADGLVNVQGTLKPGYNPRWLFHRDAVTQIRKIKDGLGNYVWMPGLANGTPNQILGVPYIQSEFVPNTFTTGLYVGMYGDFSYYWILDSLEMQMKVLNELYAETDRKSVV